MMIIQTIQSLSVPTRLEILELLRDEELTSTEIASHFSISAPAVSQHLKVLEKSGLVKMRKEGVRRYYQVRREGFVDLKNFIDQFWEDSLIRLKEAAEEEERQHHEKGND
ncbi:metalloregulator ArsR/SmtB family transcription factor [Halobacillus litoralis]|uniref:ArsR/SmtB family transcription factor n=1 Tax=Halobacillus litoralis TaxID=45668 RepID=UPI001CFC5BCB|nr:metalloregulator ArsR/SmtB family transcription factor [Halobacillus litoralis]WLR48017.1 metalloregulator ArsR/SmtB family transcription factor [Halobacillus litoralis]